MGKKRAKRNLENRRRALQKLTRERAAPVRQVRTDAEKAYVEKAEQRRRAKIAWFERLPGVIAGLMFLLMLDPYGDDDDYY